MADLRHTQVRTVKENAEEKQQNKRREQLPLFSISFKVLLQQIQRERERERKRERERERVKRNIC